MPKKRKMTSLALDPKLIEHIDQWIERQSMPPSKTAFFELALRRLIDEEEAAEISRFALGGRRSKNITVNDRRYSVYGIVYSGFVVYVGYTKNIRRRAMEHQIDIRDIVIFNRFDDKNEAEARETDLIRILRPRWNKINNPDTIYCTIERSHSAASEEKNGKGRPRIHNYLEADWWKIEAIWRDPAHKKNIERLEAVREHYPHFTYAAWWQHTKER